MLHWLGTIAGVITVGSFLPQVVRAWRTKRTGDLSLGTFALLVFAGTMWMVYGAFMRDWPVVATNAGMVAMNAALAVAKVKFS